jgi:hypothetical protein
MTAHTSPVRQNQSNPSPFAEVTPKLSNDQIAARISFEIKRLQHRRRGLHFHGGSSSPPPSASSSISETSLSSAQLVHGSSSTGSLVQALSGLGLSGSAAERSRETPLLTLRQVGLVCERLLKEREDQLREEYDKVLNEKLTEQYEAFLKFNYDQLNRRYGETAASYVS